MPAIYPSTDLKKHLRQIKEIADQEPVCIAENGRGKYMFMSEEVFDVALSDAVEDALYERRLAESLNESRADFVAGRYFKDREGPMKVVESKRAGHGEA